ncbi:hypothetical protein BC831DRAFT_463622 [Entophlyctis helioformis]|nr:hypothetical protein BC831DRAFT_463622 [Entophlyctis helioformis]
MHARSTRLASSTSCCSSRHAPCWTARVAHRAISAVSLEHGPSDGTSSQPLRMAMHSRPYSARVASSDWMSMRGSRARSPCQSMAAAAVQMAALSARLQRPQSEDGAVWAGCAQLAWAWLWALWWGGGRGGGRGRRRPHRKSVSGSACANTSFSISAGSRSQCERIVPRSCSSTCCSLAHSPRDNA